MFLIRRCRLVPIAATPAPPDPVDVRIVADSVAEIAPSLQPGAGERVLDADGRWLIPGLWDRHVHLTQWALTSQRLDLTGAGSAAHAVRIVADHLAATPDAGGVVVGFGHRSASWPRPPTVVELDAVSGGRPVLLISGDAHHAWANSPALTLLGLPPRDGVVAEREWFDVFPRLDAVSATDRTRREAPARAARRAAARGVVGIGEMEFAANHSEWPQRTAEGLTAVRVRAAVYPDRLEDVLAAGHRSGDVLDEAGLVTMGPLKVITDGSLNTRTAWCHQPYAGARGAGSRGVRNYPPAELAALIARAHAGGLTVALHAIGDAAVSEAMDVVEATGATGSVEHAQLIGPGDPMRMSRLGMTASVQPAHLLDDRELTMQCWPDRADRCFALRSLAAAGVVLALGSDAPVAPLDPWLAMAAAVWRGADDHDTAERGHALAWNQAEAISPAQALAASVDGRSTVAPGAPADLALLDGDPLSPDDARESARALRAMRVALTFCGGRITHDRITQDQITPEQP